MSPKEREELLIRLDERTERMETWCTNHMAHHQRLLYAFIAAGTSLLLAQAGTIITLVVSLIRRSG